MKTFITLLVVVALGVGAFFYLTRPTKAPTTAVTTEAVPVSESDTQYTKTYRVSQDTSSVSFSIKEELSGQPKTAIGTTNQVAADIAITEKPDTPAQIKIGTVKIDARTFKTDSTNRDGAINRFILKTEDPNNAYIVFTPSTVTNAPTAIVEGKAFIFTLSGNLTISGITKPATFTLEMTRKGDTLTGTVTTTLKRSDYNLKIPNIPFVANVSDQFTTNGTFTATKIAP